MSGEQFGALLAHALIAAFAQAMDGMRDCRVVILILRDTPCGGNTDVARGINGRFIAQPGPDRDLSDLLAQTPFDDPIVALTLAEIGRIAP